VCKTLFFKRAREGPEKLKTLFALSFLTSACLDLDENRRIDKMNMKGQ
jgi:hypothetical protein